MTKMWIKLTVLCVLLAAQVGHSYGSLVPGLRIKEKFRSRLARATSRMRVAVLFARARASGCLQEAILRRVQNYSRPQNICGRGNKNRRSLVLTNPDRQRTQSLLEKPPALFLRFRVNRREPIRLRAYLSS